MTFIVSKTAIPLVKQAHTIIHSYLKPGDTAIDATVGNGHDTVFLLDLIAPGGTVFGFDIQQQAINKTRELIDRQPHAECARLIHADHAHMPEHIPQNYHGKISAVMFNLGYLPGSDKQIITKTESTIAALKSACRLLTANGVITVLVYPGHSGGDTEAEHVQQWCERLNREQYHCQLIINTSAKTSAPRLYVIKKTGMTKAVEY